MTIFVLSTCDIHKSRSSMRTYGVSSTLKDVLAMVYINKDEFLADTDDLNSLMSNSHDLNNRMSYGFVGEFI